MKKICVIAVAAVVMAACGESGLEERAGVNDNAGAEALLQVRTRGGDETTVSYPVQVFVFAGSTSGSSSGSSGGDGSECLAVQTIGDAGQALNIALTEGTYSVYAVGGASSADYDLPAQRSAIANAAEGKYYLYRNADGTKYYYHRMGIAPDNQAFGSAIGGPWPDSFEILLRPVAVVTVAAE